MAAIPHRAEMYYPCPWKRQRHANTSAVTCWPSEEGDRMSQSMPISAADVIAAYIEAKDRNHLQLLERAFVEGDCEIELADKTNLVSLPSSSRGLEQIAQMLATFGGPYENIRTFCLSRP